MTKSTCTVPSRLNCVYSVVTSTRSIWSSLTPTTHSETSRAYPIKKPIADLAPGSTQVIETRIGIRESREIVLCVPGICSGCRFGFGNVPNRSDRSDKYRRVDFRKTFIRVSERYVRSKDARFLLIANQRTNVNDIEKWTQLAGLLRQ